MLKNKFKSYHIITIGCQMNKADSERISAFLESQGLKEKADFQLADLVILTTCGVRQAAEDRAYGLVNQIRKANPKAIIVITGCLSKRKDVKRRLSGKADLFMPIGDLPNLLKLLENLSPTETLSAEEVRAEHGEKYLGILPKHQSTYTAFVPIGNGCDNFCAYCVVPYARGREVYRPAEEIISEVEGLIERGYREIVLIAQNVNSYHSHDFNFPKLLKQVLELPGEFWVRFSSSHPKDLSDDLIALFAHPKMCNHLHLAVQSGDDEILKRMNRKYTAEHYQNLIKKARIVKPDLVVTTDVIVGFPGETKKQFQNSVKLFKEVKFASAYTAQYSPRPGTASYLMEDDVPKEEKKRREKELTEILAKTGQDENERYVGREIVVLVDGINRRGKYYGKSSGFKTVLFSAPKEIKESEIVGRFVLVRILKAQDFGLEGALVNPEKEKSYNKV